MLYLPEMGFFSLLIALFFAICQTPFLIIKNKNGYRSTWILSRAQFVFTTIAFCMLAYALLSNNFSVRYVAENSNTHLPIIYRLTALWGAHSGSMLLWVFVLSFWSMLFSFCQKNYDKKQLAIVFGVLGFISIGFYSYLLICANPFIRLLPHFPIQGNDLNPVLQDPGLIIHPPFLYLGYVGFVIPFAMAIATLKSGSVSQQFSAQMKRWVLLPWILLTVGIVLGSWWSYRELGWGGWWFWDPVENASFLPWLAATALLHVIMTLEKNQRWINWAILLAITTFSLSLLGTFLVRSGVLISIHAFAENPKKGAFLLYFLAVVLLSAFVLFLIQSKKLQPVSQQNTKLVSKTNLLLSNSILLFISMIAILVGTLYPLFISALGLGRISVMSPYFNSVFIPLMIPVLLLLFSLPFLLANQRPLKYRYLIGFILLILISSAVFLIFHIMTTRLIAAVFFWIVLSSLIMASTILFAVIDHNQIKKLGMIFSHCGIAIIVIGIAISSGYSMKKTVSLKVGETTSLGHYQLKLNRLSFLKKHNYKAIKSVFTLSENNKKITLLSPQLRRFDQHHALIPKAAIHTELFGDFYISLLGFHPQSGWLVLIAYKPFIRFIWLGGLLIVLGGLLSLKTKSLTKFP